LLGLLGLLPRLWRGLRALLHWRCLGALRLLRLRPLLLGLLGPLLRLWRGLRALLHLRRLWARLLRGWRRSVLFGFALLAALRIGGGQGPKKQKQRAGGGSSNELHGIHLHSGRY
jgi:hypothetical protein